MLVKLSYAFREGGAFIRVDGEMHRLPAYFDNPELKLVFSKLLFLKWLNEL